MPEIKTIQVDILSAVNDFCKEQQIKYSMAYGTMLGAVRHKGYIPWDDDIDICMLRKDYERFLDVFPECLYGYYKIAALNRTKHWHSPFAKVYDNRTILKQEKIKSVEIGVNIDVFPMDDVPGDINLWRKYWKHQQFLLKLKNLKAIRIVRERPLLKNIALVALKGAFLYKSQQKIVIEIDRNACLYDGQGFSYVYPNVNGITKGPLEKSLFTDIIDYSFEDKFFKGFKHADYYLRMTYGNYMQLPPESERVGKHNFKAYWKYPI